MERRVFRLCVVAACMLAFMVVFSGPVGRSAAAEQQNVLKFGSLVPLAFKEGVEIKKWHDLFAKMVAEKGGLSIGGKKYQVQFFTYDVGYMDSAKTLAAVQKAIYQDGVKYLVDNFGDVYNLTVVHADQNKVLYLGVGFGDETVSTKYQYFFRPFGGYFTSATNYLLGRLPEERREDRCCLHRRYGDRPRGSRTVRRRRGHGRPEDAAADLLRHGYGRLRPIATKIKSLNVDWWTSAWPRETRSSACICRAQGRRDGMGLYSRRGHQPTDLREHRERVGSYFDGSEMLFTDPRGIPIVANDPEMKALIDRYTKGIRRVPDRRMPLAFRLVYHKGCDDGHTERRYHRVEGLSWPRGKADALA